MFHIRLIHPNIACSGVVVNAIWDTASEIQLLKQTHTHTQRRAHVEVHAAWGCAQRRTPYGLDVTHRYGFIHAVDVELEQFPIADFFICGTKLGTFSAHAVNTEVRKCVYYSISYIYDAVSPHQV